MNQDVLNQIRVLKFSIGFLTVLVAGLIVFIFWKENRKHFEEINVERINIIERDGKLRLVISNQKRQHPGMIDGKIMTPRERPAGMIFFNDDGDENGGLIFDGGDKGASMVYSIDQYKNDQIMQLQYQEDKSTNERVRSYGFKLWDRSDDFTLVDLIKLDDSLKQIKDTAVYHATIGKLKAQGVGGTERLFLGETKSKAVGLFIRDSKGRLRIELSMDKNNNIVFQVRDSTGRTLPFNNQN